MEFKALVLLVVLLLICWGCRLLLQLLLMKFRTPIWLLTLPRACLLLLSTLILAEMQLAAAVGLFYLCAPVSCRARAAFGALRRPTGAALCTLLPCIGCAPVRHLHLHLLLLLLLPLLPLLLVRGVAAQDAAAAILRGSAARRCGLVC